jgi:hypothetical protein
MCINGHGRLSRQISKDTTLPASQKGCEWAKNKNPGTRPGECWTKAQLFKSPGNLPQ